MTPLTLTFGVEIEFLAIISGDEGRNFRQKFLSTELGRGLEHCEDEQEFDIINAIRTALIAAGVPTNNPRKDVDPADAPYSTWNVGMDCNFLSDREAEAWDLDTHYEELSIELSSRVFTMDEDWRREIKTVLDVLRELEHLGYRFLTNDSSGLHVHCGNGKYKVPFRVCKNVCLLGTALERCTDVMHSNNRIICPAGATADFYHAPLSYFHRNNGKLASDAMLYDWLAEVESTQDYEELGHLFVLPHMSNTQYSTVKNEITYGHHSAYNFENLWADMDALPPRYEKSLKRTIEFRQHAGTLDFLEIVAWVSFTTSLVQYCADAKPSDILALLARGIDLSFELPDFLSAIGCPNDVKMFLCRKRVGKMGDDEDDEILGFLGEGRLLIPGQTEHFDEVLAVNDVEQSERMDAVENVWTTIQKDYGFDFGGQSSILSFPQDAIDRMYVQARLETFEINEGMVDGEEDIVSDAMTMVLERLSKIYKGDREELEIAAATNGPVVVIERHPEWLPGYEGHMIVDDN